MAIVFCVWNLIHPFPFFRQRTCSILLSFVSRNALWHGKSFCYKVLQLFHCFYCRLAYSSLRTRSEWGFGFRWNIELATFFECLYFQLANLNFNSHFASLQAWVSSPGIFLSRRYIWHVCPKKYICVLSLIQKSITTMSDFVHVNLVDTIQTTVLAQSLSNFTYQFRMMRGGTLFWVMGSKLKVEFDSVYNTLRAQYRLQFKTNHFHTSHVHDVCCKWYEEGPIDFGSQGQRSRSFFFHY